MQNGLGVFLAGGLGGFLYLQKKDKVQLEEQLTSELSSERSTVDELKQKVWALVLKSTIGIHWSMSICSPVQDPFWPASYDLDLKYNETNHWQQVCYLL